MARFGSKRGLIGLDIGTNAVRAAEIRGGDRSPTVARFGQVLLPPGAVRDGEIEDVAAVGEALASLWKRAGFSGRTVRVGVANRRVVVRQLELPAMSRDELKGAIQFQAQEYIPIPLSEAVMDFEVVDEITGPDGEALQRVVVVAAEREMVDQIIQALQFAKLEPVALELNAYPLVRALGTVGPVAADAEAIVDIGAGVTNVIVHRGGHTRFVRILSIGGDHFTRALSSTLGVEWDEAEALKHKASLLMAGSIGADASDDPTAAEEEDELDDADAFDDDEYVTDEVTVNEPDDIDEATQRAIALLGPQLDRLVDEIRGSLDFYTSQPEALPLGSVVVTGGGSLMGGFLSRLASVLRMNITPGRVFENVKVGKVQLDADQIAAAEPFLAVAVGLAVGGLED